MTVKDAVFYGKYRLGYIERTDLESFNKRIHYGLEVGGIIQLKPQWLNAYAGLGLGFENAIENTKQERRGNLAVSTPIGLIIGGKNFGFSIETGLRNCTHIMHGWKPYFAIGLNLLGEGL
jgi:hypothetical protein